MACYVENCLKPNVALTKCIGAAKLRYLKNGLERKLVVTDAARIKYKALPGCPHAHCFHQTCLGRDAALASARNPFVLTKGHEQRRGRAVELQQDGGHEGEEGAEEEGEEEGEQEGEQEGKVQPAEKLWLVSSLSMHAACELCLCEVYGANAEVPVAKGAISMRGSVPVTGSDVHPIHVTAGAEAQELLLRRQQRYASRKGTQAIGVLTHVSEGLKAGSYVLFRFPPRKGVKVSTSDDISNVLKADEELEQRLYSAARDVEKRLRQLQVMKCGQPADEEETQGAGGEEEEDAAPPTKRQRHSSRRIPQAKRPLPTTIEQLQRDVKAHLHTAWGKKELREVLEKIQLASTSSSTLKGALLKAVLAAAGVVQVRVVYEGAWFPLLPVAVTDTHVPHLAGACGPAPWRARTWSQGRQAQA
jgi:hypothetical protein